MACVVKRNKQDIISEVYQADGKTPSKVYATILKAVDNGLPGLHTGAVMASLDTYVGKYIRNTDDHSEIALGLYIQMYDKKFQQWYGEWTVEPEVSDDLTVTNDKGVTRSLYEFGKYTAPINAVFNSARTAATKKLIGSVETTVKELKSRIKLAIDAREKSKLNSTYNDQQKIEREKYYNGVIKTLNQQIETLTKNNVVDYVLAQGLSDMELAKKTLAGPVVSLTEVQFVNDITDAWRNIDKILGLNSLEDLDDPKLKERAEDILANADKVERQLQNLARKLLVEAVNKNKPADQQITVEDLAAFKDVQSMTAYTRDITAVDNKMVAYLAEIINKANSRITREHNDNYTTIDEAYAEIADHAEIQANGFDIFIKEQTNGLGQKTIGLRGRFSQTFYDTMRAEGRKLRENLKKAGDDKEAVKVAYKAYNDFMSKHTFLFNSAPFINAANHTDAERETVIQDLRSQGFTDDEVADMIAQADKNYKRYLEDADTFTTNLQLDILAGVVEIPEGMTEDQFLDKETEEWKKINDPIAYIEHMRNRSLSSIALTAIKGGRYAVKFPQKTIDGKDAGYYDENFTRIAADPKLYKFYTFFRDFIGDQLKYLPEEEIDGLQSNFLPVIVERMAKEYGFTALKDAAKNIGDWFFKHLTIVDYKSPMAVDPVTGKKRPGFTPRFINEDVDTEERSKDLVLMMKLFSDMALVYKHKIQIQDTVDTIGNLVNAADSVIVEDEFGNPVKKADEAPTNLQKMVGSAILRSYYNVPPEQQGVNRSRKFYNIWELVTFGGYKSEKFKKAKALSEKIDALQTALADEALKEDDRRKMEKELKQAKTDYYKLGGRNISISSVLDGLTSITRQKGLAFNPFSAFRNLMVGGINNMIHAAGGEDFSFSEIRKATNIIKASSAKYISWGTADSETAEKILKFMLDAQLIDGEDGVFKGWIQGVNKKSVMEKIKKYIPSPLGLMKSTDYLFKAQTAVSMLLHQKVKTEKGEFMLYEVLDKNLEYNKEKFGEWLTDENNGRDFEAFYEKFVLKVGQVAKKLHGFSGAGQSLMGKDTVLGRMMFLFKTWLPETVATRFEKKRYDATIERDVEGYYRTFWNRLASDEGIRVKGVVLDLWKAAFSKDNGTMTPEQAANMRKLLTEMAAIVALYSMYFALKAAVDDDDEGWKKLMVNQLNLLNRDLTYYSNPASIASLQQNVIPAVTTITQGWDAIKASANYIAGTTNDDGDPLYDSERTFLKISKALPIMNNVNRVVYYSQRIDQNIR